MYADEIIVTKHAVERFYSRVNTTLSSNDEVEKEMAEIFKSGRSKKIRESVLTPNATEFTCEKDGITIKVVLEYLYREDTGKKYKRAIIVTCLGDEEIQNWYKNQRRQFMFKAARYV